MSYSVATGGINFGTATLEPVEEDAWSIGPAHTELTADESSAALPIWPATKLQPSSAQHSAGDQMQSMPQADVACTGAVQPPAANDELHGRPSLQPAFASSAADDASMKGQATAPAARSQDITAPQSNCEAQNALSSEATLSPNGQPGPYRDGKLPIMQSHETSALLSGHVQESLNNFGAEVNPYSAPMGSHVSRNGGTAGLNGNDLASIIQKRLQPGSPASSAAASSSYADTTPLDTDPFSLAHSPFVAKAWEVPWSSSRVTQPQSPAVTQKHTSPAAAALQCSVHAALEAHTPAKHGQQAEDPKAEPSARGARQPPLSNGTLEGLNEHPVEQQNHPSRDSAGIAQDAAEASQPGISAQHAAAEEQHSPQDLPHTVAGQAPQSAQKTAPSDSSSVMLTTEIKKQVQESKQQQCDSKSGKDDPAEAAAHSSPMKNSTSGLAAPPGDARLDAAIDPNPVHSPADPAQSIQPKAEQDATPSSALMASFAVAAEHNKPSPHSSPAEPSHPGGATSDSPELRAGRSREPLPGEGSLATPHAVESDCTVASTGPDHAGKKTARAEMYDTRPAEPGALPAAAAPASLPIAAAPDNPQTEVDRQVAPEHTGSGTADGATAALAAAGEAARAEDEHATQAELLALASAVTQLGAELADSQQAAAMSKKEAQAAREEAAQWQDREADARTQAEALREAYADMRSTAEAAQAQSSELQATEKDLRRQVKSSTQQARASEQSKMRSRLDKAERAIEQERAQSRALKDALQALQQGSTAQQEGSTAKMAAELSALKRDLADACATLAAQKASNKGLQIRVAELLAAGTDAAALQESCTQLRQERDALLAAKNQWISNENMLAGLKAQNNALHVTTEKLVSANSELMERVNEQSKQVAELQDALSRAQTTQPLSTSAPQRSPGGVRITETELELVALAEYVQELEGKLAKLQGRAPGQQEAAARPRGMNETDPHELPSSMHVQSEPESGTKGKLERAENKGVSHAAKDVVTEAAEEVSPFLEEQVDAMKASLRPKDAQQRQVKHQSRSFWGAITDYITGADKLLQLKR